MVALTDITPVEVIAEQMAKPVLKDRFLSYGWGRLQRFNCYDNCERGIAGSYRFPGSIEPGFLDSEGTIC